jgi:hypothetical protein
LSERKLPAPSLDVDVSGRLGVIYLDHYVRGDYVEIIDKRRFPSIIVRLNAKSTAELVAPESLIATAKDEQSVGKHNILKRFGNPILIHPLIRTERMPVWYRTAWKEARHAYEAANPEAPTELGSAYGWKFDGIEGYIYPKTTEPPYPYAMTRLWSLHNGSSFTYRLATDEQLATLTASGYVVLGGDYLGWVFKP